MIILSLIVTPSTKIKNDSSHNGTPEDYSAWYVFMQDQGKDIQYHQDPFGDIEAEKELTTLIHVNS